MDDLKYIGMDVHSATTTIAVQDSRGRLVMEATVATQAAALSDFLRGLRGRLWLTFEEGNWAAWLTQVLTPQVEKLIVCNPRRNASLKQGSKERPPRCASIGSLAAGQSAPARLSPGGRPADAPGTGPRLHHLRRRQHARDEPDQSTLSRARYSLLGIARLSAAFPPTLV